MNRMLIVAVVLMGCGPARLPGAPAPGSACTTQVPECSSAATISSCEAGKWTDYDCGGGCSNAQEPRCIEHGTPVGATCPSASENHGFCAGDTVVQCTAGKWVSSRTCTAGGCIELSGSLSGRATCR